MGIGAAGSARGLRGLEYQVVLTLSAIVGGSSVKPGGGNKAITSANTFVGHTAIR